MARHESTYQHHVVQKIKDLFPGCIVLKNDPTYMQGIPDIIILYEHRWAALEFKARRSAPRQPNQEYYVDKMRKMSFASFIYPENEEEVFDGLQIAFGY